jgi:radical SAM-linked protein
VTVLRLNFTKTGLAAFLSHLDLMRVMERALRRAAVPVSYTEGFNPRMRLAFGPALPVGTASIDEYCDVELQRPVVIAEVLEALNRQLPAGVKVKAARLLDDRRRSLDGAICLASYELDMAGCVKAGDLEEAIGRVLAKEQWVLPRSRDRAPRDVRGSIERVELTSHAPAVRLHLVLRVGPAGTVRPGEVLDGLLAECGGCFDPAKVSVTRTGLYVEVAGRLVPPWQT